MWSKTWHLARAIVMNLTCVGCDSCDGCGPGQMVQVLTQALGFRGGAAEGGAPVCPWLCLY